MQARKRQIVVLAGLLLGGCAGEQDAPLTERLIGPPQPTVEDAALLSGGPDEMIDTRRPNRVDAGLLPSPELFSERTVALWDGKPTLAGLWISHPDAEIALRVRMTNPRTGTMIDGALLPGAPMAEREVLISAEAADALGLRPRVPAEIELVAVERAVARAPEPDRYAGVPAAEAEEVPEGAGAAAEVLAAAPEEAAPPDTVVASPPAAPAEAAGQPAATDAPASGQAAGEGAPAQGFDMPAVVREAVFTPTGPAAAPAAAGARTAGGEGAVATAAPGADAAAPPAPAATAAPSEPYRPSGSDTAAAPPAADATAQPSVPAVVADAAPSGAPAAAADAAQAPSGLEEAAAASPAAGQDTSAAAAARRLPYIQAGLFAERDQAADLVRTLTRLGIPARNLAASVDGEVLSRVVAGPFATDEARERALSQIRGLGITDAQPTSG